MSTQALQTISLRKQQLVDEYRAQLDTHIEELRQGIAEKTFEIRDLADLLHVHPTHLSNTLNEVLGSSPCDLYEQRLVALSQHLLLATSKPISDIARQLHYDPSNFTKFFKHYVGVTPKDFRKRHVKF
jgi:AraC family transcriptional regulator, regulatory protein of adaptative response / methylphosphotriester-DNA alkyltransferase methyltransferase